MNYAVVDSNGNVVNVIIWDGVSPYNPGVALTLVQSDVAAKGWTYASGVFTPPSGN